MEISLFERAKHAYKTLQLIIVINSSIEQTMKKLLTLLFATGTLLVCAQYPAFEIPGSQVKKLTSTIVANQEYDLHILLPPGHEKSNKKYPVLYLMDSQWDFPLVSALQGQQYFDGFVPPVIIIGVTWGGTKPNPDSLRARDYTPTNEARSPQSGGAENFLSFIENELFPFVENNYKADTNNRTLVGCSLGGLFTLYTLFTKPSLFQKFIAATPAIGWDNEVIYQYEKQYFESGATVNARVFICEDGVERGVQAYEKFVKHLTGRNYKNLKIQTRVLENTGHSGTKGEGYARGLQYVFQRTSLKINPGYAKAFTGSYRLPNGIAVEIKLEDNQLNLYFSPNNKYILKAATETDYYSTAEFLNVRFKQDPHKNVTGFYLERFGGTQLAKNVK